MDINSRIQELTKLTSSDYDAEYWKTTRMDMHLDQKSAWVYLAGYKDEAAFDAGLMPVTTQRIKVIEDLTNLTHNNINQNIIDINSRTEELTKIKDENDQSLLKNKQTLEQLSAEIRAGEMRDIAITNRLDEIRLMQEEEPVEE